MLRLIVFYFLLYTVLSVTFHFLPVYFEHHGMTTTQVGMLTGAGSLISIFANPIWGYVCDKRNSVKPVLIFILAMSLVTSMGLYSARSFPVIFVFMIVLMFFQGPAPALLDSLAVSTVNNYGAVRMWGSAGLTAAAFFIGHLTGWIGIGWLWIVYASAAVLAIGSGFTLKDIPRKQAPITWKSLKLVFGNRRMLMFLLVALIVAVPNRMNENMLSIFLSRYGASDSQIGLAWTTATLSAVPIYAISDFLLKGRREMTLICIAAFLFSIRWLLYGLFGDPTVMPYLQLMNGITFPLFFVASIRYVATIVPDELRAIGQTTYAAVFGGIGGIVGSTWGGWAMDHYSLRVVYIAASVLAFIGAAAAVATTMYSKGRMMHEHSTYRDTARQTGD